MTDQEKPDYATLRWVREGLDETIHGARQALEDYLQAGFQGEGIDRYLDSVHQLLGTLRMLQVYGAGMLLEEMERVGRGLSSGELESSERLAESLMLGLVQLPGYLQRLEKGEPDIPLVLMPVLNDLRAARGIAPASEVVLYAPSLNRLIEREPVVPGSGSSSIPALVRELRNRYHKGLLAWYRDVEMAQGLDAVLDVLRRINAVAGTRRLRRLMDSAEALVLTLMDGEFTADAGVKQLFGRLDQVFKQLIKEGEEAAVADYPTELLKSILYFVSRSHSTDAVVQAVKRTADLANSFPDQLQKAPAEVKVGADEGVLDAVSQVLMEDLREIKETLDLYIRGEREDVHRLQGLDQQLLKVADTLGMLGRGALRERLTEVATLLSEAESGGRLLEDDELMKIATTIVGVESVIYLPAGEAETAGGAVEPVTGESTTEVGEAVIKEAFSEFSRIKEGLEKYLRDSAQASRLEKVAAEVHKLTGVFMLIGLDRVVGLLQQAEPELLKLANAQTELSPFQRGALVDLFAAVDYYLEATLDGRINLDEILDFAGDSLHKLVTSEGEAEAEIHPEFAEPLVPSEPVEALELLLDEDEGNDEPIQAEPLSVSEKTEPVEIQQETERAQAEIGPSSSRSMDEIDPEIFDIFMEEAAEELDVIQNHYPKWRADTSDEQSLQIFRRSFHTLKGSGRMVGAQTIGEFAWAVENLLNRVMDGTVSADEQLLAFLDEAVAAVPVLVQAQAKGVAPDLDVAQLEERAFVLAEAVAPEPSGLSDETLEDIESLFVDTQMLVSDGEEMEEKEEATPDEDHLLTPSEPPISLGKDLLDIFLSESASHLAVVDKFLQGCEHCLVDADVVRAVHTLRGSSHLAEVEPMAALAGEMEIFCNHLHQLDQRCDDPALSLMRDFHDTMRQMLDVINQPGTELPDWEALAEAIRQADHALPEVISELQGLPESELLSEPESDQDTISRFMQEAARLLEQIDRDFGHWDTSAEAEAVVAVQSSLHVLKESARQAGLASVSDLADGLVAFFLALKDGTGEVDRDTRGRIRKLLEEIENALDLVHLNGKLPDLATQIEEANRLAGGMAQLQAEIDEPESRFEEPEEQEPESILLSESWEEESSFHPESSTIESRASHADASSAPPSPAGTAPEADPELLEIFLEEAVEIGEWLEEQFNGWEQDITARGATDGLMRSLHTLKGNSRFAGLFGMGDLSHAMESLFENLSSGQLPANEALLPLVRQGIDRLQASIDQLQRHGTVPDVAAITLAMESAAAGDAWELPLMEQQAVDAEWADSVLPQTDSRVGEQSSLLEKASSLIRDSQLLTDSELLSEVSGISEKDKVLSFPMGDYQTGQKRQRPSPLQAEEEQTGKGERVRVLAELLDQLVNSAGEVSIYRARLERQNTRVQYNLDELNATVSRLRNQLRALEMEAEAQIRSRHEREQEDQRYTDFDPLEMDRYSTVQQLSRALSETISDLSNIGDTLGEQARDADTLLLQQARVITDLQEGLLRSRMVPFKRQASRLQRVVRQTAQTLGKKAELDVQGAQGEIDRTILNRIMGPLEHLLRNAVAHGIEPPEKRLEHDKPETGRVSLVLTREGSEVVLNISDDGAGLDAEAIRHKAVQNGLLEAEAEVDEDALYQFILQPGFTTASEVSQVAGRGVGMDAVVSEIKQLGGSLEILSQQGRGSSFVVRLPFTLAISEALLVQAVDDVYAIPHGSAEVIIRASRQDLLTCYRGHSEGISYGGHLYRVHYLGSLLGMAEPALPENSKWFPLLLVRVGEQRMAVQVDQLLGNSQVVVKSLGAQLSGVRWFTGGTILADGKIALLLDMNAVIRSAVVAQPVLQPLPEGDVSGITVMVVDDSITVRKVTSRLLDRHNMNVITAKDGVDAITVLQDHYPDVMLLDIEMPHMDGYELARHIRNTPELADIPIIMITSRTGEKHRKRALELGVDRYLGKPYQETELLENIYALLAEAIHD